MLLGFVQNWLAPRANPIGVDFGSDSLRLAQVAWVNNECRLIAAASADVPQHVRHNADTRLQFFVETTRDLLTQGNFRGRQAILALPAASMFIQHLRIPKMDENETRKALPWEARGKLPIDPSQALIRHLTAGEVYQDQEPKNEVIVMAAAREWVNRFLAAAARAKLDVIGMNVEPKALVDCFAHVYRRKTDSETTNCFVDIGAAATRAVISRGDRVLFARSIPIGGDHFTRATAHEMRINLEEAKLLRIRLSTAAPALDENRERQRVRAAEPEPSSRDDASFALLNSAVRAAESVKTAPVETPVAASAENPGSQSDADLARRVEQACREPLNKLIEELDLGRRYHEATFPNRPVERLVFVGGEARQRTLCQHIARELQVAAQLGDPLVRMGRVSDIGIESGIDRRQPQPGWAVAIGLSLGPSATAAAPSSVAVAAASTSVAPAASRESNGIPKPQTAGM